MVEPVQEAPRRGRSCFLVGCMVLVLLAAVPVAALWAIFNVAEHSGPAKPRHVELSHPLPAGDGAVTLHLSMAEVDVVAAPADAPLRLVADWDDSLYELHEGFHPGGSGWTYDVDFRGRGLRVLGIHNHRIGDNRIKLYLPAGHPLSLEGKLAMGEADLALGGLALRRVDLAVAIGEHRVSFAEPTSEPLELLRMRGSMGELTVLRAGNASPRLVDVRHGMGDLTLDLSGAWRNDADVELKMGMGDSEVQLPSPAEARAEVMEAHMGLGDRTVHDHSGRNESAPGAPHVRIRASGGMGELRIE